MEIQHSPEQQKFFTEIDGAEGYLRYAPLGEGKVDFQSTFVPPALRGQGVAEAIVERGLQWAEEENLRVVPSCWYVDAFLRRHPRFQALRAEA